jgi:L-amino acid N-acyltransferase YncA
MKAHPMIRLATLRDAPACLRIYAPVVEQTTISFEVEVPSVEEMERRIADTLVQYPWLILEESEGVQGYAYGGLHRKRSGYQWSVEVSVYVAAEARGRGAGQRLYTALFDLLRRQGYVTAFAGIALPNEASVGLHEAMGFVPIGTFRHIGFKLGRWVDVGWWQLPLQELSSQPAAPLPITDLQHGATESFTANMEPRSPRSS